jgi:putative addiction module component (TIGR02574 family)
MDSSSGLRRGGYDGDVGEDADKLLAQALRLSLDERAELVAALMASIEQADGAWAAEIESRARRALAGKTRGRPWREVLRDLGR